jgi:hypothetical protein
MMCRFEYNHFLVECEKLTSLLEAVLRQCLNFSWATLKDEPKLKILAQNGL